MKLNLIQAFPTACSKLMGTSFLNLDRDLKGDGKIVFVRKGIFANRLPHCESPNIESIRIELTISKRKWCILFAYRPPNFNKGEFFNEISNTLSKALKSYDNIVLAGDHNNDLLDTSKDIYKISLFYVKIWHLKN